MKTNKPFSLSVKALIRNDTGEFLIIKRSAVSKHFALQWDLPGGKLDPGETFEHGLLRETMEETGFQIALDGVICAFGHEMDHVNVIILLMEAHIESGCLTLSSEHVESAWISYEGFSHLGQLDLSEQLRGALPKILSNLGLYPEKESEL